MSDERYSFKAGFLDYMSDIIEPFRKESRGVLARIAGEFVGFLVFFAIPLAVLGFIIGAAIIRCTG